MSTSYTHTHSLTVHFVTILYYYSPDFPCALDVGLIPGLNRSTCDSTYAFRHRLNFTSDASAFEAVVRESLLSASPDAPESILDAVMQIAACEVGHVSLV